MSSIDHEDSSGTFARLQQRLAPYVKPRQEVLHIRRVLAAYVHTQIRSRNPVETGFLLDLPYASANSAIADIATSGLREDYLAAVRANIKAQERYADLNIVLQKAYSQKPSKDHQQNSDAESSHPTENEESSDAPLDTYVSLINHRHLYERLQIYHKHLEHLAEERASSSAYFQPQEINKGVEPLPVLPVDVISSSGHSQHTQSSQNLQELVFSLEKSVLRAKALVQKEKRLLSEIRADNVARNSRRSSVASVDQLQALGHTRNELIAWIESELGKTADESSVNGGGGTDDVLSLEDATSSDDLLAIIPVRYAQYIDLRKSLLNAVAEQPLHTISTTRASGLPTCIGGEGPTVHNITHQIYPYLEDLLTISQEQKDLIQQKSHLASSLLRHRKDAAKSLERLSDESHLLPAHPMPVKASQKRMNDNMTLSQTLAAADKTINARLIESWVFAAESAGRTTKDTVQERVEDSQVTLETAYQAMAELQLLVAVEQAIPAVDDAASGGSTTIDGADIWTGSPEMSLRTKRRTENRRDDKESTRNDGRDHSLWSLLDGNLGVIGDGI